MMQKKGPSKKWGLAPIIPNNSEKQEMQRKE
jgi:hypothetical protein